MVDERLAQNWFGDGLLEAGGRLGDQRTVDFLGILEDVQGGDLAPTQGDHVNGVLGVPVTVEQRCGAVPLHEHHGVPRPALHPDIVDLQIEVGQDAGQPLEPLAQSLSVMPLTTDRVDAAEAMVDARG